MALGDESQAITLLCVELSVKFTPGPPEKVLNNSPKQPTLTSVLPCPLVTSRMC